MFWFQPEDSEAMTSFGSAVSRTFIYPCRRMAGVTDPLDDLSPQYPERPLSRWERWATDETGQPIVEFDAEAHGEWYAKWAPPCPVGNPQRLRRALGFRERHVAELELRVPLGLTEPEGACQVIVDERDDEVYGRVMACYEDEEDETEDDVRPRRREYVDCPVRVWLDRPLGERALIDADDDEELPLYVPEYLNNIVQPDHGYHPAHRRRRRPEALDDTHGVEPSSRRGQRLLG